MSEEAGGSRSERRWPGLEHGLPLIVLGVAAVGLAALIGLTRSDPLDHGFAWVPYLGTVAAISLVGGVATSALPWEATSPPTPLKAKRAPAPAPAPRPAAAPASPPEIRRGRPRPASPAPGGSATPSRSRPVPEIARPTSAAPTVGQGPSPGSLAPASGSARSSSSVAAGFCTFCGTTPLPANDPPVCAMCGDVFCANCYEKGRGAGHAGLCPDCVLLEGFLPDGPG